MLLVEPEELEERDVQEVQEKVVLPVEQEELEEREKLVGADLPEKLVGVARLVILEVQVQRGRLDLQELPDILAGADLLVGAEILVKQVT